MTRRDASLRLLGPNGSEYRFLKLVNPSRHELIVGLDILRLQTSKLWVDPASVVRADNSDFAKYVDNILHVPVTFSVFFPKCIRSD